MLPTTADRHHRHHKSTKKSPPNSKKFNQKHESITPIIHTSPQQYTPYAVRSPNQSPIILNTLVTHSSPEEINTKINLLDERYKEILNDIRQKYENRFKKVTHDVLGKLYRDIIDNEVLNEMKTDPISSMHTKNYLLELIENYLKNERENYIDHLIEKSSLTQNDLMICTSHLAQAQQNIVQLNVQLKYAENESTIKVSLHLSYAPTHSLTH